MLTIFLVCRGMDNLEDRQKYENYVTQMTSYVKAKYFSDKTIFGGNCSCMKCCDRIKHFPTDNFLRSFLCGKSHSSST